MIQRNVENVEISLKVRKTKIIILQKGLKTAFIPLVWSVHMINLLRRNSVKAVWMNGYLNEHIWTTVNKYCGLLWLSESHLNQVACRHLIGRNRHKCADKYILSLLSIMLKCNLPLGSHLSLVDTEYTDKDTELIFVFFVYNAS